jgi:Flp pilus assembly protein TadD
MRCALRDSRDLPAPFPAKVISVPLKWMPFWLVMALLTGCAGMLLNAQRPPELVLHHAVPVIADVDVLEVTPRMRQFLEQYVLAYDNEKTRTSLLTLAVQDKGILGFHYNEAQTLTAAEAFERRSGNCVAFANLFIALAREAGLEAHYQEVHIEPEWSNRGDTLLVTKHINVLVKGAFDSYMIDVSGQKISFDSPRRLMNDNEARAMYFNNLGAEALIQEEWPTAYAYFTRAIETAPALPDAWSNLGVLLARNGQANDAEFAYLRALELNPREMAAMGNLHDIYVEQGRVQEAKQLDRRVERYRQENPYYLLQLSEEAMLEGDLELARKRLLKAISMKSNEHLLHFALARVDFLSGDLAAAEAGLEKARELAPPEALAEYQYPLEELVWRERASALEKTSR